MSSSFNRWFLVVLDNNSRDLTINKINKFVSSSKKLNNANFKLIKLNKNIGFAAAVNHVVHLQNQQELIGRPEPRCKLNT